MMKQIFSLIADERGIQHAEEALLLALIAVASIGVVKWLADGVGDTFQTTATTLGGSGTR